jgi:Mor family transcriptional regulator
MGKVPETKTDRNEEIYRLNRDDGVSYNTLAKRYDLTYQRVAQIIKRQKQLLEIAQP